MSLNGCLMIEVREEGCCCWGRGYTQVRSSDFGNRLGREGTTLYSNGRYECQGDAKEEFFARVLNVQAQGV